MQLLMLTNEFVFQNSTIYLHQKLNLTLIQFKYSFVEHDWCIKILLQSTKLILLD